MDRPKLYRYAGGIALLGLAVLLLLSIASWNKNDPPHPDYPPNEQVENICGVVGAYLGYGIRFVFGTGSYLFALVTAGLGILLLSETQVQDRTVRLIGLGIILISWCALWGVWRERQPAGYGGIVGHFLNDDILLGALGIGKYVLILIGFLIGALLAADVFVLWMGRKSYEMVTMYTQKGIEAVKARGQRPPEEASEEESAVVLKKADSPDRLAAQKELLKKRLEERAAQEKKEERKEKPRPSEPESAEHEPSAAPKRTDAEETQPDPATLSRLKQAVQKSRPPKPPAEKAPAETPPVAVDEHGMSSDYRLPPLDLLDPPVPTVQGETDETIRRKREVLERTLEEFGIAAQVVEIDRGPVITQFEIELAPGVKINKVANLSDDIARAMKAQSIRIVAPIPGKSTVGVEVPNSTREVVRLRALFDSGVLNRKRMTLPMLLGKDAAGDPLVADLAQSPHMLVAGATGSGKSVCINSMIMTILMTQHPEHVKLLLIDPKVVELSAFRDVPHLMSPVLTDMKKAAAVLEWATKKMDERYSLLANVGVRNIAAYNALGEKGIRKRLELEPGDPLEVPPHMPYIVIIIDELADMMMIAAKEVETSITRLAQKSRAVGLHLIVATQRPSVDVVTGLIKANLPSRLAFQTSSKVDSRTILDRNGAEKLLGQGDMLFLPPGTSKLVRAQGSYTSDEEIRRVTEFLQQQARPRFETELVNPKGFEGDSPDERDDLFDDAVRIILENQRGSVSLLQRKLGIGYSRAARLVDMMAEVGLLGDYKGSQAREVLYTLEQWEAAKGEAGGENDGAG